MSASRLLTVRAALALGLTASLALAAPGSATNTATLQYEQDCFDLDLPLGASAAEWDLKIAFNGTTSPHSVVFHRESSAAIAYPMEAWETVDAALAVTLEYSAPIVDRPLTDVAVVRTDTGSHVKVRLVSEDAGAGSVTIEHQSLQAGSAATTTVLQFEREYLDLDSGQVFVENRHGAPDRFCPRGWDFVPGYNGGFPAQPTVLSPNDSQPIAIARPNGLTSLADVDDPLVAASTFTTGDYGTVGDPVLVRTTEGGYYAADVTGVTTSPEVLVSVDWVRLDGISAAVDGETQSTGAFLSQSSTFTDQFTDTHLGGTTYGHVVDRAGLWVTVEDAPDVAGGVRVSATGTPGTTARATVSACAAGSTTYSVSVGVGEVVTLTCGSIHAHAVVGTPQILLAGGSTVTVHEGSAARVDQSQATGAYSVEQTSGTAPVTLTTVSSSGETATTTLEPGAPPVLLDGDVSAPRVTSLLIESDRVEVGDKIELGVVGADDFGLAGGEVSTDAGLTWVPMEELDEHETEELEAPADVDLCARVHDFAGNLSQPLCVVVIVHAEDDLED